MSKHRALVVLGLVVSVMLERAAFYGVRSALFPWMAGDLGMDEGEAVEALHLAVTSVAFAPLLGGVLALAVGPRVTLVVGAVVAALGYGVLAVTVAGPPIYGLSLVTIGAGLFRPAWLVALAREFAYPHGNRRTAVLLMAFVGIDLATMLATIGALFVQNAGGAGTVFGVGAGVSVLVAALTAGVVFMRKRVGPKADVATFGGRPEVGAGVLLLLLLPCYLATGALDTLLSAARSDVSFESRRLLTLLGPVTTVAVTLIAAAVFFVAARKRARPLALPVIGGGLVVTALGVGVGSLADLESGLTALPLVGVILMEVGEAVVVCVALARVAADTRPRTATMVLALFLVAPRGLGLLALAAPDLTVTRIVAVAGAALTLLAGVGRLVFAGRMQRYFYTPRVEAAEGLVLDGAA